MVWSSLISRDEMTVGNKDTDITGANTMDSARYTVYLGILQLVASFVR